MSASSPHSEPWEREGHVECVVCPACAFTFDACHEDRDGGYSCPACAQANLVEQLEAADRERGELVKQVAAGGRAMIELGELQEQFDELQEQFEALSQKSERQATNIRALYRQRRAAELERDGLKEQYEALRKAAQKLDDLNPTLGAFVHDDLWGAAARQLHTVLALCPAREPAVSERQPGAGASNAGSVATSGRSETSGSASSPVTFAPAEGSGGPVFEGYSYDGRTFYPGKPPADDDPAIIPKAAPAPASGRDGTAGAASPAISPEYRDLTCEKCGYKSPQRIETVDGRGPGFKCNCGWWNWLDAPDPAREPEEH